MDVGTSRRRTDYHKSRRDRSNEREDRKRSRESRSRSPSRDKYKSSHRSRRDRYDKDETRKRKSRSRSPSKHGKKKTNERGKKSRKRSSSSSSGSSTFSGSSGDEQSKAKIKNVAERIQREEIERLRTLEVDKVEKKRQKELMKATETPEQKRNRRLAKKEQKERRRKEMGGWDEEYMGYTNTDNPFGDSQLQQTFIWGKKFEKQGVTDISVEDVERDNRKKLEETKRELEKVKQRRLEREKEYEERQEDMNRQQREKELEHFNEWAKQEDGFHLKQAKLRSKLRIKERRAKPIDILARYFDVFGEKDEVEEKVEEKDMEEEDYYVTAGFKEPYKCLNGLRLSELEDLLADIKVFMELDTRKNLIYWQDMQIIVEDELAKLKNYGAKTVERREGINQAVTNEVTSVFIGKSPAQLATLQSQIETKIASGAEGIDVSYWETLLSKLKAHMAKARLKEKHDENINNKLKEMREKQGIKKAKDQVKDEATEDSAIIKTEHVEGDLEQPEAGSSGHQTMATDCGGDQDDDDEEEEEEVEYYDPLVAAKESYISGGYSPTYISPTQLDAATVFVDPDEDIKRLIDQRNRVLHGGVVNISNLSTAEQAFEREARKGMGKDECLFSVEETIKQDKSVLSWADKYRPRKPRYFNRVHTGFEWNKYNQTHYDIDNPPPKIVQGYKFNIFYPDLIDKQKTPQYTITPCSDNREFATIKFKAGPPYEDIAFKIVNREWNFSYKSGFRCQFHNNILQLWFHFKRYRYRR